MLEETTSGTNLSRKATLLMAEILSMANRILPLSFAAKIQANLLFQSIRIILNIHCIGHSRSLQHGNELSGWGEQNYRIICSFCHWQSWPKSGKVRTQWAYQGYTATVHRIFLLGTFKIYYARFSVPILRTMPSGVVFDKSSRSSSRWTCKWTTRSSTVPW